MNKNGYFKSDKDGNVTKAPPKKQPPPFSGVTSWNDLTDKPFGESATGGDTLTWDGNTEGLVSVQDVYFYISSATPTLEDFASGGKVGIFGSGASQETDFTAASVTVLDGVCMLTPLQMVFKYCPFPKRRLALI